MTSDARKQQLERQHGRPLGEKAPPPVEKDFRRDVRTRPGPDSRSRGER